MNSLDAVALLKRDIALRSFPILLAVLLLLGVVSFYNARSLAEHRRLVIHTHEVETGLEALLSTLKDAETGQRGFLLTGDESFLKPFHDAKVSVAGKLAEVKTLTLDNVAYEVCRQIRRDASTPAPVIVACTGWGQDADKLRAQDAGFNFHIVKPVDPIALEKLLNTLGDVAVL